VTNKSAVVNMAAIYGEAQRLLAAPISFLKRIVDIIKSVVAAARAVSCNYRARSN